MSNYFTPGVYIEEESTGPRPIQSVGTSTAGFIGVAPDKKAAVDKDELQAVYNWSQFKARYCGKSEESTDLSTAVYGFFENRGSKCYVVNLGDKGKLKDGLKLLETVDEIAIVAAPGYCEPGDYDAILTHCEDLKDRFAILDAPKDVKNLDHLIKVGTAASGGDAPGQPAKGLRARESERGFGAYYFPWIKVFDPLAAKRTLHESPPSGHLAGIFARTDGLRGVHKAPANELIQGAQGVTWYVTREEQKQLNINSVNCIRFFQQEGFRVWGARTLSKAASEWRYVNVRRLFNMIEESIAQSIRWVVFEPNDMNLWKAIRRDVSAYLMGLWRKGALMGSTPAEAFFVKCDQETNPPDVIDRGEVVTVIGIAPVKPAEFIIFRIGQQTGLSAADTEGGTNG